jgi:Siphovirus Gp157
MGALTNAAPSAPTLFTIEDDLQALLNSEELVNDEQWDEFKQEVAAKLRSAVDKRQRFGEFIRFCELMQSNCDTEIKRLEALRKMYAAAQDRCEQFVVYTIEQLGRDRRGRYPKLAGHTVTLSVAQNPDSVELVDKESIPDRFQSVELKLPLDAWKQVLESFDSRNDAEAQETAAALRAADESAVRCISKTAIREHLKSGFEVPGADIKIGNLRCKVS